MHRGGLVETTNPEHGCFRIIENEKRAIAPSRNGYGRIQARRQRSE